MTQPAPDSHVVSFPMCVLLLLSIWTECAQSTQWQTDTLRNEKEEDSKLCSAKGDCGCYTVSDER
jgi:hypothetical protein